MRVNQSMLQNDLTPTDSAQAHCNNVRTIMCNLLWVSSLHQQKYLKLVWSCCDEFEQVYGGYLMSYVFNCMGESIWNQRHVY